MVRGLKKKKKKKENISSFTFNLNLIRDENVRFVVSLTDSGCEIFS